MYCRLLLIYTRVIDCNEWRTEKRHEYANMGKVKRLELWWQMYRTSLPVWDLENFRPMDFCWHECTSQYQYDSADKVHEVQISCLVTGRLFDILYCAGLLMYIIQELARYERQPVNMCTYYTTYKPKMVAFRDVLQHRLVVSYRQGVPKLRSVTTNSRCLTSQKSEDLIRIAAEPELTQSRTCLGYIICAKTTLDVSLKNCFF